MSEKKITSIGGQAVIEGVMMRGPFKTAVSVRKPDGEITMKLTDNKVKGGFRKIPILRGIFAFVNSMVIGINALMFSAQFYEEDGTAKKDDSKNDVSKKNGSGELSGFALFITLVSSLALSIGLFFVLPNLVASFIVPNESIAISGDTNVIESVEGTEVINPDKELSNVVTVTSGEKASNLVINSKKNKNVLYNVVESVVKIVIFLGYLTLVSQMKDIRRVFEYHGAEHKTIFCYENGEELTVENVKKYKRFHPRCGTSFLLFVVIISIIVYSIVGRHPNLLMNVLIRIAYLPIIAGISYEIIKFAGKHSDNKFVNILNQPGMWLQRLTTREPDASQIECAINSLKAVIPPANCFEATPITLPISLTEEAPVSAIMALMAAVSSSSLIGFGK